MSAGPGPRTLAPGMKARNFSATWKRLIHELRPERWRIGLVIALTAVSVVLNVLAPKVLARATNLIFEGVIGTLLGHLGLPAGMSGDQLVAALRAAGQDTYVSMLSAYDVVVGQGLDTRALLIVLAQVLALYLTSAVFLWLQGRILAGVVQRTASRMRGEVEAKLARVPLSYIDRGSRGDMLSRVTNDVDNVSQTLQQTLSQAFNSIITVIGVFAMMLTVSWQLTLVAVVTIPLAMIISVLIARQAKPHFTQQWKATGEVSGVVEEAFTGHEAVALFNSEETFADLFEQANNRLYEGSYKAQWISGTIQPAMRVVSNLNFVIIAVVGGIRITQGAMTLGDVQAFIQYSQQFTQPITQLASMANLLQSGAASAERVFEVLDAPEESEDTQDRLLPERVCGRVVFDHVRFSYTPDTELITDLNLTVEPGQTVAIVGPTGAGKTTLVNLLLRFYDPQSGTISLDGVDTRDVARGELREQIGMVLQDTWLFEGTIRENITFGAASASQEQVLAAARAASVDHIIRALPQGYDTVIDDSGSGVSAGEKQLITIARAFLADRQILVLDEATSSVDTRTELLVQKAMVGLRQGRTSFVIAHRLSTIRDADVILVMEHGDIVEQGSHDELMARHGAYFELYQSQFSGPADEESAASGDRA
ncbi:MAG: putative xenobiotic-transporting ATPase [Actinomyces urogenitalis DORA_12]|uniref:Fatty acid ABC transporter ATP-binding/permease protein n=1 Tax=Actinomyces urogenitalis DORA_12 TaxID=1403939 RepID=W1VM15_9ACTO|nr:ABC transporter transmembrane domain-containing protein [Actinomyces urogenitalis]ETJ06741.1 MAG: putative xenobiotic-transporting ATPase [Actinomyces urogenitalis DORA_12]MDU0863486.1 ABC transporter transmembrane domain-containing protein [Actinomyces urogenitalis]MDU0873739.1 ABC transporter transmembrane domain-containing protein [Actinomyces urogenitalis]MDU1563625.1 ABC transporter transmembrane domain-containing protein [Actinomyces urogenitalis]MDU1638992.1 ABC transporter transmemb